jgi:hypothetical protein
MKKISFSRVDKPSARNRMCQFNTKKSTPALGRCFYYPLSSNGCTETENIEIKKGDALRAPGYPCAKFGSLRTM